jgi:transposase-like protein
MNQRAGTALAASIPILKPMVVACGLRFLGGAESHKSLEDAFHISKSSSKREVRRFATAVVQCEALKTNYRNLHFSSSH